MNKEAVLAIRKDVGVIPWWVRHIPGFTQVSGMAFRKRFLLKPSLYKDLMSENPSDYVIGIAIHELEHMKRFKEIGFLKYRFLYRVSPSFRYREELACHKPQFKYLKQRTFNFDIEKRANILSGSLYLWCVSYKKALDDLKDIWEES